MNKKETFNISVLGANNCGKSTICGHMLLQLGLFSEDDFGILEGDTCDLGHEGYEYAWITNNLQNERKRDLTIENHICMIELEDRHLFLYDTPGHKRFLNQSVKCAAFTGVYLIVLDESILSVTENSKSGYMEFLKWKRIYEPRHTLVAVNKMDCKEISWSEDKFNQITEKFREMAKELEVDFTDVPFVPVSGFLGENLIKKGEKLNWYKGPTLLDALKQLPAIERYRDEPLRISVLKKYPLSGEGTVIDGIIVSGTLEEKEEINILPSSFETVVNSIQFQQKSVKSAIAGDLVGILLPKGAKSHLGVGSIIESKNNKILKKCKQIVANLHVIENCHKIKAGYSPPFYFHTARLSSRIIKLTSQFDRKTGELIKENPPFLVNGESCKVVINLNKPLAVTTFEESNVLGKFIFRDHGMTLGYGYIIEVRESIN
ncbi:elongation factor 1-alpha 2 [Anaeramoeba flamelloides]|uniref:Elongation factor 1-alpha 2 n=1 Tax=Anaeramoeba flamelloides TaxID=1746091 RepID=A0ABQ8XZV3_9EUKA|nr:elongation factor 1-alpha 2 [Anaeramoeba flamelloides]